MMQKKICLLGAFSAGKTSLVSRFVHGMFSDRYVTTVGVRIERKTVDVNDHEVDLVIWDVYGENDFQIDAEFSARKPHHRWSVGR